MEEMKKVVRSIKNGKAHDCDGTAPQMVKYVGEERVKFLIKVKLSLEELTNSKRLRVILLLYKKGTLNIIAAIERFHYWVMNLVLKLGSAETEESY